MSLMLMLEASVAGLLALKSRKSLVLGPSHPSPVHPGSLSSVIPVSVHSGVLHPSCHTASEATAHSPTSQLG